MSDLMKRIRAVFGSNTSKTAFNKAFPFRELGYVNPDGDRVPDEYLVRISSRRHNTTVVAPLQENISMHTESFWGPAVPKGLLEAMDKLLQGASGGRASLITKATTRRMWYGSSPIRMQLHLVFQAYEDPVREVVEPTRILQSMALPALSLQTETETIWRGIEKEFPILAPPGPTPYNPEGLLREGGKINSKIGERLQKFAGGDEILVEIGQFLTFSSVVVTSVTPTIPAMFNPNGNPVRSEVSITFETYEMMTVEDLSKVYNKTNAPTVYKDGTGGN